MDATELCLVPDVLIPAKFKVPEFEKYDGTKCPMAHITMYCRKMAAQFHDDKLLIHFFQDSLTGSTARWYVQLDRDRIKTWKDLARAFIAQYKHVAELAPDRLSLQTMEKKQSENFKEYAQRWRDTAEQVQPPLTDKEMTVLFINTLRAPFYERLVGNATKNFTDLVLSGEIIEGAIKSGKIEGHEVVSSKRGNTPKKKEGDVQQAHNFNPYYPYPPYQPFYPNIGNITQNPYVYQPVPQPTFQTNVLPQTPPPRPVASTNNLGHSQRGPKTTLERPKFDPIPVPYTTLLPQLIENRLLARTPLEPLRPPFQKWYDPNAHCDYHFGIQGHSTENCTALKHKVQALIKAGLLNFDKKDSSSVDGNPLPNHGGPTVNAIHEGMIRRVKKNVDEIRTSIDRVFEALSKIKAITLEPIEIKEVGHDLTLSCKFHMGVVGHSIQNCDGFRLKLQELMDLSEIEFYEESEEEEVWKKTIPFLYETFRFVGCKASDEVNQVPRMFGELSIHMIKDEEPNEKVLVVYPVLSGEELSNWIATELPIIFKSSEM
ncbi:Retrotransposon gag domain - like 10 [Theobroma cacao]|nr:Retrotransposon gag domain - like 10 [Theobroma cacao]